MCSALPFWGGMVAWHAHGDNLSKKKETGGRIVKFAPIVALGSLNYGSKLSRNTGEKNQTVWQKCRISGVKGKSM